MKKKKIYDLVLSNELLFITLLILPGKNYQRIPPGTLDMFLRLWMITEMALMKIFALKVLQPGGAALIFPKSG